VTPTPHDALFRAAFAQPERAAGLLRHIFPSQLVDAIAWDTVASAQGVFVDRKLDPHATDLLFRAALHGYPDALIYSLIEHLSGGDSNIPLRLIDYSSCICWELRKECPAHELPTVLSVVVSHAIGGWKRPRCYDDMFTCRPDSLGIAEYVPRFTMLHLDLSVTSNADLRSIGSDPFAIATLWALRDARTTGALLAQFDEFADVLRAMIAAPNGRDDAHTWLRYILIVAPGITAETLTETVHQHAPELEEPTVTAADLLRQEGREQGRRRGHVEMLTTLLTQRFGPIPAPHRERLAEVDSDQLRVLAGKVMTASSLDELFADLTRER
jgi:hypothetical protein